MTEKHSADNPQITFKFPVQPITQDDLSQASRLLNQKKIRPVLRTRPVLYLVEDDEE
ncbi:MAG: hypothetical protein JW860_06525 [Sedimentisphaerales bacterium]|nr:hypothetical protein [Sedimentisphaerales bacterium]